MLNKYSQKVTAQFEENKKAVVSSHTTAVKLVPALFKVQSDN